MPSKAASLKKAEQAHNRSKVGRPELRLVSPQPLTPPRQAPADPVPAPAPRKFRCEDDPLEQPIHGHCGLCGNKIEGQGVTEKRTSGRNLKAQTWSYHEVCWKQLERMRRTDHDGWSSHKAVNPEIRYSARGSGLEGFITDSLSFFAG